MLFLFNDAMFDVSEPRQTALDTGARAGFVPETLDAMRIGKVVKMVREAIFDEPQLARTNPEVAHFLAAMMAWKTDEANAVLAVAPRNATLPAEVQVRLAAVSLITMTQLNQLQIDGKLSSHAVNLSVWMHAPSRLSA